MARIINDKYLFIHCAKTGGTFVRELFNYYGIPNWESGDFLIEDHYSYRQTIQKHPELDRLESFGFVRYPVSWYRSRWAYAKMTNFIQKCQFIPSAKAHWMYPVWSDNLNEFVENTIQKYPDGIASQYFEEMLGDIYSDKLDLVVVDRIFRYEEIIQSCKSLLVRERISFSSLDPVWQSRHKDSQKVGGEIHKDLQDRIRNCESRLIDMFY